MEDKLKPDVSEEPSRDELLEGRRRVAIRERLISRTRAAVVRSQVIRAYEILENIRFDHVSDTAFRDKITRAKKNLERAIDDFLLSDRYHEDSVDKIIKMTPKEYDDSKHSPGAQGQDVPCSSKI